eukprot:3324634-Amphidinium_carterae.1
MALRWASDELLQDASFAPEAKQQFRLLRVTLLSGRSCCIAMQDCNPASHSACKDFTRNFAGSRPRRGCACSVPPQIGVTGQGRNGEAPDWRGSLPVSWASGRLPRSPTSWAYRRLSAYSRRRLRIGQTYVQRSKWSRSMPQRTRQLTTSRCELEHTEH